ncbi:fukutin [Ditylenchus destructor]|uniref:Fukutin n=1 Tax=Ditylenchus destructor TaxID=166010 RepID=A0AAD4MYE5_9BILA|nr:fukutin [Ditylenchus destructor]
MNYGKRRFVLAATLILCFVAIFYWINEWNLDLLTNGIWILAISDVTLLDVNCLNNLEEGKVCSNPSVVSRYQRDGLERVKMTQNAAKDYVIVHYLDGDRAFQRFDTTATVLSYQENGIVRRINVLVPKNISDFIRQYRHGRFLKCGGVNVTGRLPQFSNRIIPLSFVEYLAEFRDLMWRYNTTAFILSGTLLGWRRECSIIPHTEDIDFGALIEEFSEEFYEKLKRNSLRDFRPKYILGNPRNSLEIKMTVANRPLDLFYVYPNASKNSSEIYGMRWWWREPLRYTYPRIRDLCAGDLLGRLMYVPCNVDKVLEADYGRDWEVDKPTNAKTNAYTWDRTPNMEVLPRYNGTEWPNYFYQF